MISPVIQNIFKEINIKLSMNEEILVFRWQQKPIADKLADLMAWNEKYGKDSNIVNAAEKLLQIYYPNEYMKYLASQQKFAHSFPFYSEKEAFSVSEIIDWLNNVYAAFGGMQEGLLGGLVVSPYVDGAIISVEYEKGKLVRILNKGDGDDATMLMNAFEIGSIPKELTVKKDVIVRGVATFKKMPKLKGTVTSAINEILMSETAQDVSNIEFHPNEWLAKDGIMYGSKKYQTLKDQGFIILSVTKLGTLQDSLGKCQEYFETDFGIATPGVRFEIEKSETCDALIKMAEENKDVERMDRIVLMNS